MFDIEYGIKKKDRNNMKIVLQKVTQASVTVAEKKVAAIGKGYLLLVGIETADTEEDIDWLVQKIANIRLFENENGIMHHSILETNGDILAVSQFTLHASTKKGNRPSYIKAARPEIAKPMYETFVRKMGIAIGKTIQTGVFGAMMQVFLVNDGPVTIIIDSKNRT